MSSSLSTPHNVNPIEWQQNLGYARQACARIFRDGGKPADALKVFGLAPDAAVLDWSVAVDRIAATLTAPQSQRRAA
jgi:hypothetical protein